jgi:polyhydroxyalkanoate synthesis regulator phasin
MNKIKETKIQTPNGAKKVIEAMVNNYIQVTNEDLAEKDKTISKLEAKIDSLEKQK